MTGYSISLAVSVNKLISDNTQTVRVMYFMRKIPPYPKNNYSLLLSLIVTKCRKKTALKSKTALIKLLTQKSDKLFDSGVRRCQHIRIRRC